MVGVPRSSGCRICVQRRVRCDGARPICNNCRKGNRPCPGYGPGVKFQDEGPKLREKFQKGSKKTSLPSHSSSSEDEGLAWALTPSAGTTPTDDSSSSAGPIHWNILGEDIDDEPSAARMNVFRFVEGKTRDYMNLDLFGTLNQYGDPMGLPLDTGFSAPSWVMLPTPVASPESQQLQLLSNFTQAITPPESRTMPKAMRGQGNWLAQLPSLSGSYLLLDAAIRAVTLVHIGIIHRNEVFMNESRPYYGKALRLLNNAIADEQMGMDNRTLCATILLSFYEMFASDSDASWVRHAGGAATLMRLRGAKRHRYGFDRDIFLAYRYTLVIEAMSQNEPSFLDEPEWRQLCKDIYADLVSNNQIPSNRIGVFDIAEEFYSQLAAVSVVSAKGHKLNMKIVEAGGVVHPDGDIEGTYRQLQTHHDAIQKFCRRWLTILKQINLSPPLRHVDDPVVPYQYQYTNVFIASLNMGFWTTLMLTNCTIYPLAQILGKPTDILVLENEEYAMDACRSVDFMLSSSFLGPFFLIYALRFAVRIFKPGDIRGGWALCKLVEIGDRRMQFARGAFGGGPYGPDEKPEVHLESARRRLAEFNAAHGGRGRDVGVS